MKANFLKLMGLLLITSTAYTATVDTTKLDGSYEMKFVTGDHTFYDQMQLKGVNSVISPMSFNGPIAGQVTVPGAFSSPLEGNAYVRFQWSGTSVSFDFSITAHENSQDYKVYYKGRIAYADYDSYISGNTEPVITGEVFVDGEKVQKKIGTFRAVRHAE